MQLPSTAPPLLRSLTVIGSPVSFIAKQREHYTWIELVQKQSVRPWAETTMRGRLRQDASEAMLT